MDMIKFLNKRKKENRQSLIIDNFNVDALKEQLAQRRNSISSETHSNTISESPSHDIQEMLNEERPIKNLQLPIQPSKVNEETLYKENYREQYKEPQYKEREINKENDFRHHKENEILNETHTISRPPRMDKFEKPIVSGVQESEYYNSTISSYDSQPQLNKRREEHTCNLCHNQHQIKDSFMILTCGHIFHIRCLVDSHYTDANRYGVIDEEYLSSRKCCVCSKQMEMEDILYIHNKFYRNTKEYITKQDDIIDALDKQMTKLKEELRVCYEYKQKLEHQREKSRQITVTINTMM